MLTISMVQDTQRELLMRWLSHSCTMDLGASMYNMVLGYEDVLVLSHDSNLLGLFEDKDFEKEALLIIEHPFFSEEDIRNYLDTKGKLASKAKSISVVRHSTSNSFSLKYLKKTV